ncbi:MAG: FHA domain-containing protein [Planctomycetes bacterium]|nr:FHA domain-containing protein [Planctomycetota bacterium]
MISYQTFLVQFGSLGRDDFLKAIEVPYVLITQTANAQDSGFLTVKFTKEAVTKSGEREGSMVLAVRKRPDANAFGMMITIGRAANNDLVIEHQKISKFHAYFREAVSGWRICDANSRNGTTIGEVPVEPGQEGLPVKSGARIKLGKAVSLVFLEPADLYNRCLADRA